MEPNTQPLTKPNAPTKKTMLVFVLILVAIAYAGVNVLVFQYARKTKDWSNQTALPVGNTDMKQSANNSPVLDNGSTVPTIKKTTDTTNPPQSVPTKKLTPTNSPLPTPSPTPLQGPGEFACSPQGTCNSYSSDMRSRACPTSFADPKCLGQCGDATKRCSI